VLLVDAYNALHVTGVLPPHLAGLDGPGLAELIARSRWGSGAVLVCDGVKPRGWPRAVEGVELRYAGPGRDADTLLERMIGDSPDPRRLTVVSSDNRVRRAGKRSGCKVLSSEGFLTQLAARIDSPRVRAGSPASGKPEVPLDAFAIRRWLEEFGVSPEELRRMAGEASRAHKVGDGGRQVCVPGTTKAARDSGAPARARSESTRPPSRGGRGREASDLSDAEMRSMLADAFKMWSAAELPADLDVTAWLDTLINPDKSDGSSPRSR
jgi:hypothetical protein